MPKTAAAGNFSLFLISVWMVGNVEAPEKLNIIEQKA